MKVCIKYRNGEQRRIKKDDIKNRACYCFDDIVKNIDINFSDILLNEKLYENITVYDISYKTLTGSKPLCVMFDKIDGFRGGEFRHIVLFNHGLLDKTFDKIKYTMGEKSGITDSINHNFGKIRIDSYNYLPI